MKITTKSLAAGTNNVKNIFKNMHEYFRPDELCEIKPQPIAKEPAYFSPTAIVNPAIKDFKPEITYFEF